MNICVVKAALLYLSVLAFLDKGRTTHLQTLPLCVVVFRKVARFRWIEGIYTRITSKLCVHFSTQGDAHFNSFQPHHCYVGFEYLALKF